MPETYDIVGELSQEMAAKSWGFRRSGDASLSTLDLGYCRNILANAGLSARHGGVDAELLAVLGIRRRGSRELETGELQQRIARWQERQQPRPRTLPEVPPVMRRCIGVLRDVFGLDDLDGEIVTFIATAGYGQHLTRLLQPSGDMSRRDVCELIAAAIQRPYREIDQALAPGARLGASGVVHIDGPRQPWFAKVEPNVEVLDLLDDPELSRERLLRHVLPTAPRSTLDRADFAHVGDKVAQLHDLLRGAIHKRAAGVNVIVYGATGTGKTELARLLAGELGVALHVVNPADRDGDAAPPSQRLRSALVAQRILAKTKALVLFDEFDDAFAAHRLGLRGMESRPSKSWVNALLEQNAVPTIWLSNDPSVLDEAMRRRFTYALEMRPPTARVRGRALRRHMGSEAGTLGNEAISALAENCVSSPAQIANAIRATRLVTGGAVETKVLREFLASTDAFVAGRRTRPAVKVETPFRFDLLRCSQDVGAIAARLGTALASGMAVGARLLLNGPPGTGKSEYARQLARTLDRRTLVKRGSDVLSKWVGESEQRIAAAFEEARVDGAVLVFDEVDSLLRDREGATLSWEVSQVNEFLQQLEAHDGLVVCTTNHLRNLDAAALRRFHFKVEFGWSTPAQAVALFRAYFEPLLGRRVGDDETAFLEAECERLARLTPGDFAVVAARVRILGGVPGIADLLAELGREVAAKGGAKGAIGFAA